jgi:hypothetical protein
VGRQLELAVMHSALAQAGVGKSRLVDEFIYATHTQSWRVLDSAAVSYGKATPYFLVLGLLRRYYHLEECDVVRTIQAKVTEQVLTLDPALQGTIPALLALLDALPVEVQQQYDPANVFRLHQTMKSTV